MCYDVIVLVLFNPKCIVHECHSLHFSSKFRIEIFCLLKMGVSQFTKNEVEDTGRELIKLKKCFISCYNQNLLI